MISILIPVFNEESILRQSVEEIHSYLNERSLEHEILVTNNGSTDRTYKIGIELENEYSWFRFFSFPEKGVGRAFAKAAVEAKGDFLISLDIDLSFDLKFIEYANDLLRYADVVVGSKTMGKQNRYFFRIVASQVYILFTQTLFKLTISDYSIGCKAYRRNVVLPALPHIDPWTGYVFELCTFLNQRGKKIIQIGVDCNDTRESHFNLLHEGLYRYLHIFRCWRKLRSPNSWFNTLKI